MVMLLDRDFLTPYVIDPTCPIDNPNFRLHVGAALSPWFLEFCVWGVSPLQDELVVQSLTLKPGKHFEHRSRCLNS